MRRLIELAGLRIAHSMDPERAHNLAIKVLEMGLAPQPGPFSSDRLRTDLAGLSLPNPIGLAAGFDKNARVIEPLSKSGFGFVEVGAITPMPQPGNRAPRLFRLTEDRGAINRFGFNNDGMDVAAERLRARKDNGIVGLNLGANKDSSHRAIDYVKVLETCGPYVDFATVNVSSPNTEKLRDLQGEKALNALLSGVMQTRDALDKPIPIFLKIAPDLDREEISQIAAVARHNRVDAIIATNTTLDREGLQSPHAAQKGGLSGQPLFEKSTRVLAALSFETEGTIPLVGVGGVSTAEQALAKIKAGATAVQFYTEMVYSGVSVAHRMAQNLDNLVAEHGVDHISALIGTNRDAYL